MAEMKLYKQDGTYKDKQSGEDKRYTRFYLQLGSALIPIEPCYFAQDRFDGRDPQFAGRKEVLRAFAEPLPPKESKPQQTQTVTPSVANSSFVSSDEPDADLPFLKSRHSKTPEHTCKKCGSMMRLDDTDRYKGGKNVYYFECDCGMGCIAYEDLSPAKWLGGEQ